MNGLDCVELECSRLCKTRVNIMFRLCKLLFKSRGSFYNPVWCATMSVCHQSWNFSHVDQKNKKNKKKILKKKLKKLYKIFKECLLIKKFSREEIGFFSFHVSSVFKMDICLFSIWVNCSSWRTLRQCGGLGKGNHDNEIVDK